MFDRMPIIIEVHDKADKAKSLIELYGPLVAALIVGLLALLGILIKSGIEKRQKLMDIRIGLHKDQIKMLSDLCAEVDSYCRSSLVLLQIVDIIDNQNETCTVEEITSNQNTQREASNRAADQRTIVIRAATAYGTIPGSPNNDPIHLSTYIEEWMDNVARISQFDDDFSTKADFIIAVSGDVSRYIKKLITYEEVQRSHEFGTNRNLPTLAEPPAITLSSWAPKMARLYELTEEDEKKRAEDLRLANAIRIAKEIFGLDNVE